MDNHPVKTCLFCKEQVNSEALKCRFCQSTLVSLETSHSKLLEERRVTYVLDRDLVRFGKFAGAVLALFLVVGAYLFGFKLDSALEKVRDTQEKFSTAQRDLEATKSAVNTLKASVESILADARHNVDEISKQRDEATNIMISFRQLNPRQTVVLQEAKAAQPQKIHPGSKGSYWASGATLRVRFLDGNDESQRAVKAAAQEWTNYANLRLEFVTSGPSEIRVSFKNEGSWSFVGTDALAIPQSEQTINLGSLEPRTILHEFGHTLGLIEEHQNPKAGIKWNKDLVYRAMGGPPNNWSRQAIEDNVFAIVSEQKLGPYRDFDPDSVMLMDLSPEWAGGVVGGKGKSLSASDKALIARLYPK